MGRVKRYWLMIRIFLAGGGYRRASFLKKINYFGRQGEHCYLQPWNFGTEPELICLGDNVHIASGVHFINHDISAFMFRYMDEKNKYRGRTGAIEIGNNVFVGAYSILLYDIEIGSNVIIGAGSVVTHNIPDGVVAAGVPCKVIGKFEDYKTKLMERAL